METQEIQAKQQAELHIQLWAIANDLRGSMDASEFKNYILGLIFYRYLSDKLARFVEAELEDDDITYKFRAGSVRVKYQQEESPEQLETRLNQNWKIK